MEQRWIDNNLAFFIKSCDKDIKAGHKNKTKQKIITKHLISKDKNYYPYEK